MTYNGGEMFLALSVYIGKNNSSFPSNNDQPREKPKANKKMSLGSESCVTIAILAVPGSLDNLVMPTDSPLVLALYCSTQRKRSYGLDATFLY